MAPSLPAADCSHSSEAVELVPTAAGCRGRPAALSVGCINQHPMHTKRAVRYLQVTSFVRLPRRPCQDDPRAVTAEVWCCRAATKAMLLGRGVSNMYTRPELAPRQIWALPSAAMLAAIPRAKVGTGASPETSLVGGRAQLNSSWLPAASHTCSKPEL